MINGKDNPVEWAQLSYELEDTIEHLRAISKKVSSNSIIDETDLRIELGHVYAHLNRIWNTRNQIGDYSDSQREEFSQFPTDIAPVG